MYISPIPIPRAGLNNCNLFVTDITIYSRCTTPGRKTLPLLPYPSERFHFIGPSGEKVATYKIQPYVRILFHLWWFLLFLLLFRAILNMKRRCVYRFLLYSFSNFWKIPEASLFVFVSVPSRFYHSEGQASDVLFTKRGNICSYA